MEHKLGEGRGYECLTEAGWVVSTWWLCSASVLGLVLWELDSSVLQKGTWSLSSGRRRQPFFLSLSTTG